jgi:pimeloyl-ACP methyl ester carboxylesterase
MKLSARFFTRCAVITILLFSITGCLVDRYQIRDGMRNPVFLPMINNNYKGHLFWYYNRDSNGKVRKSDNNKKVIFDKNRDTIIFVHGWQGNGSLGWTQHSLVSGPMRMLGPVTAMISMMYNVPGRGATMPDVKRRTDDYNIAIFDWQSYNNIDGDSETSQNLTILESNLKNPPDNWPDIPENLAQELELFINETGYNRQVILVAHSFGNQVVTRAYNKLSEKAKARVRLIAYLDPFTTNYFDYMGAKMSTDYHWITGATSSWIKDDLTEIMKDSDMIRKTVLIYSSDIGKAWDEYFASPLEIRSYDDEYEELKLWQNYGWKTMKKHEDIVGNVFYYKKFDQILGIY